MSKVSSRLRFVKLRYFITSPCSGEVGRGSGRVGPSPGLRARLSQRESNIPYFIFTLFFYRLKWHRTTQKRNFKTYASGYFLRIVLGKIATTSFHQTAFNDSRRVHE